MSGQFALVPAEIFQSPLSSAAKLVFCCLRLHADKGGAAFPSLMRLQKEASLSRWSVLKGLSELESAGLISRIRRRTVSGDPDSTLYRMQGGCSVDEQPCLSYEQRCSVDAQGVVCQTNRGCSSDKPYQDHLSKPTEQKIGESPEDPSSRKISKTLPLRATPFQDSKTKEGGGYQNFDERIKGHFRMLCSVYPKKTSTGMKIAFALFRQFFSDDPEDQEKNSDRLTNVLSAAAAYRDECKDREPKYIKSFQNWLREIDPDIPVMVEVETLVRCPDEMGGDVA